MDRSVRQLVTDTLAVYDIDTELLAALAADVIVTQDLCRVCAVSVDDVRAAVARLVAETDLRLVSLMEGWLSLLRTAREAHQTSAVHDVRGPRSPSVDQR